MIVPTRLAVRLQLLLKIRIQLPDIMEDRCQIGNGEIRPRARALDNSIDMSCQFLVRMRVVII